MDGAFSASFTSVFSSSFSFSGRNEVRHVASMSSSWSRSLLTCSLAWSRSTLEEISPTTLPSLTRATTFSPSAAQPSMVAPAALLRAAFSWPTLSFMTLTLSPTLRATTTGAPTAAYKTLFVCIAYSCFSVVTDPLLRESALYISSKTFFCAVSSRSSAPMASNTDVGTSSSSISPALL